jgi:serine/threonine protein kinase
MSHSSTGQTGYTHTVDLWSMGIVIANLLTGDLFNTHEERLQHSQEHLSQRPITFEYHLCRPRDLVNRLLVADPAERLPAREVLEHPWFREPAELAEALLAVEGRALKRWKPRATLGAVVHELPDLRLGCPSGPRRTCSTAPHFHLDRLNSDRDLLRALEKRESVDVTEGIGSDVFGQQRQRHESSR